MSADVSEVRAASIIRALMMEAAPPSLLLSLLFLTFLLKVFLTIR
jgi:hypothetical protein